MDMSRVQKFLFYFGNVNVNGSECEKNLCQTSILSHAIDIRQVLILL